MRNLKLMYVFALALVFLTGCIGNKSVVEFIKEGGLETGGLVNLALASNGTRITVSQDNPDHPASTLNNGITSSENWNQGEGWETSFQGRFARGGYLGYGAEDPELAEERGFDEGFDPGDAAWRGLRMQTMGGRSINTALGWVIVEFPERKMVNRAVIHTIDSEEYPAEEFGVRDISLQYWNDTVDAWAAVERMGKSKGQTTNAIHGNQSGVVTFRFQPLETSRMRLIVRWTNDSEQRRRGYYMHTRGVVRLVEIELYGYEEKKDDERETAIAVTQDANEIAEIGIVVDNYVDGYNKRNVDALMSSVSQDYSKDGETYSKLWKRMESVLAQYERVQLGLQNIKIAITDKGATATCTYAANYRTNAGESISASGTLNFQLSRTTGYWKITRIDSQ